MKTIFLELQKSYERLLKKKEKGVVQNYKESYKKLRRKLEKAYDKFEKDGDLKYSKKDIAKLDKDTASIMISLYKDNEKLIKSTLKEIFNKTKESSINQAIVPIKKEFNPEKVIEKEVAGRIWTERIKHYGNNFVYDVHSIIKAGLERGDTYTTMSKDLRKKFGKNIGNTVRIARTEGARVVEDTKFRTFEEINKNSKVKVIKIWHTMQDEAVRDTHQAMEGVEVGFDEEFILPSGASAMYPKASGVASEDINCRCYCEYKTVLAEENYDQEEIITDKIPDEPILKYTKEETDEALEDYVSGDGMWINNHLRGRGEAANYPLTEDDKIYLEKLDQATLNSKVKERTLYRSVDISSIVGDISDSEYDDLRAGYLYKDNSKAAQEVLKKYLENIEGKEIIDKGLMSTTKDKEIALDFQGFNGSSKPCVIEFNVPKGIKGVDLKAFDIEGMEQKEVLLARGQKFVITSVSQEQGQFYFKADLIPKEEINKVVEQKAELKKLKSLFKKKDFDEFNDLINIKTNKDIKKLYGEYADRVSEIKLGSNSHYNPTNNSLVVEINNPRDALDKGKFDTVAHEFGHLFDYTANGNPDCKELEKIMKIFPKQFNFKFGKYSTSTKFINAIREDKKALKAIGFNTLNKELINYNCSAGVQDAIDGMFEGAANRINWGHGEKYYNRQYNIIKNLQKLTGEDYENKIKNVLEEIHGKVRKNDVKSFIRDYETASEAWANIASAETCQGESLKFVKKYLPNSYKAFIEIIKEIK